MAKEKYVSVCPICYSSDIHIDSSNKLLERFGSSANWKCNRCKNSFPIYLEVPAKEAKDLVEKPLTEEILHSTPNKMRVGAGYAYSVIFAVLILITIIIGLIWFLFQ